MSGKCSRNSLYNSFAQNKFATVTIYKNCGQQGPLLPVLRNLQLVIVQIKLDSNEHRMESHFQSH